MMAALRRSGATQSHAMARPNALVQLCISAAVPSWRSRRRANRDLLSQDEERTTEALSLRHEALGKLTYDIGQHDRAYEALVMPRLRLYTGREFDRQMR
jgi:hypothetical protein